MRQVFTFTPGGFAVTRFACSLAMVVCFTLSAVADIPPPPPQRTPASTSLSAEKLYRIPKETLRALNAADATDDPAQLKAFLRGRPPHELDAMRRYLFAKRRSHENRQR